MQKIAILDTLKLALKMEMSCALVTTDFKKCCKWNKTIVVGVIPTCLKAISKKNKNKNEASSFNCFFFKWDILCLLNDEKWNYLPREAKPREVNNSIFRHSKDKEYHYKQFYYIQMTNNVITQIHFLSFAEKLIFCKWRIML